MHSRWQALIWIKCLIIWWSNGVTIVRGSISLMFWNLFNAWQRFSSKLIPIIFHIKFGKTKNQLRSSFPAQAKVIVFLFMKRFVHLIFKQFCLSQAKEFFHFFLFQRQWIWQSSKREEGHWMSNYYQCYLRFYRQTPNFWLKNWFREEELERMLICLLYPIIKKKREVNCR